MSMLKLTSFPSRPHGETVFKITETEFKEDFGKLIVTLQTATGYTYHEWFTLPSKSELEKGIIPNPISMSAFSVLARAAMGDWDLDVVPYGKFDWLIGHFVRGEATDQETEWPKGSGNRRTFLRVKNYRPASGFNTDSTVTKPKGGFDMSLLD